MAYFKTDAEVELYYDNALKFETYTSGVVITGNAVPNANDGGALGGVDNEWSDLYLADGATIQFGNDQDVVLTHVPDSGIRLSDSDKLLFGAGDDGQLYSDGTNMTIVGSTAVNLYSDGFTFSNGGANETLMSAAANGAVTLYHDNGVRFHTTADGSYVTGQLIVDSSFNGNALQVDTDVAGQNAARIIGSHASFTGNVLQPWTVRDTNSAYDLIEAVTNNGSAVPFRVRGDGQVTALAGFHPMTSDGAALGSASLEFSDLYLADSATIQFGNDQEIILTHVPDSGIRLHDSDKMMWGDGNDLQIYHDGSNSYIDEASGTGSLIVKSNQFIVRNAAGSENMFDATQDGAVNLYYDSTAVLTTVSGGVNVTGGMTITDNVHLDHDGVILHFGDDNDITLTHVHDTGLLLNSTKQLQFNDASQYICGASATQLDIRATDEIELTATTVDLNGILKVSNDAHLDHDGALLYFGADSEISFEHVHNAGLKMNGHLYFADNKVAHFGTSSDLQIYHDGSNSHITDQGTGVLAISTNGTQISIQKDTAGEAMAYFKVDGAVELYYDNAKKLETTSSGVTVTGTVVDSAGGGMVPPGTVLPYTGASAPTGFVLCDDSAISRTTYSVLFAIIGTSYGTGNGTTTFNVPDLRDRLPLGKGTNNSSLGAITAAAGASAVVATASGSASLTKTTGTFATSAKDSSQASALTNVTSGGHTHNLTLPAQVFNYIIKT